MNFLEAIESGMFKQLEPGIYKIDELPESMSKIFDVQGCIYMWPNLHVSSQVHAYDLDSVAKKCEFMLSAIRVRNAPVEFAFPINLEKFYPILDGAAIGVQAKANKYWFFDFYGEDMIPEHVQRMLSGQLPMNEYFGGFAAMYADEFRKQTGENWVCYRQRAMKFIDSLKKRAKDAYEQFKENGYAFLKLDHQKIGSIRVYLSMIGATGFELTHSNGLLEFKPKKERMSEKIRKAVQQIASGKESASFPHEDKMHYIRTSICTSFPGHSCKQIGKLVYITKRSDKAAVKPPVKLDTKLKAEINRAVREIKTDQDNVALRKTSIHKGIKKEVALYLKQNHPDFELLIGTDSIYIHQKQ